jgi:monoamine oxidase
MFRPHDDPYIRSGYSSFTTKTPPDAYERMQQPFGRLRFAGETCSDLSPTTVGGAMLTGQKAANNVIEQLRKYG